jgi:hypothetical protein
LKTWVQKKFEKETDPELTKYASSPGEVLVRTTRFPDGDARADKKEPDSQAS